MFPKMTSVIVCLSSQWLAKLIVFTLFSRQCSLCWICSFNQLYNYTIVIVYWVILVKAKTQVHVPVYHLLLSLACKENLYKSKRFFTVSHLIFTTLLNLDLVAVDKSVKLRFLSFRRRTCLIDCQITVQFRYWAPSDLGFVFKLKKQPHYLKPRFSCLAVKKQRCGLEKFDLLLRNSAKSTHRNTTRWT